MIADILFVYPLLSSFVQRDLEILRDAYTVREVRYARRTDLVGILSNLPRARMSFCWFALGYAYPLVRFGMKLSRPCILVTGGYDVEAIPELGYGAMLESRHRIRTSRALADATKVLAVSQFTRSRVMSWAPESRVEVVYHGFPRADPWESNREGDSVVTVGEVAKHTWKIKGIDYLLQVAAQLPDVSFEIVGKVTAAPESLAKTIPGNVHFRGWLEPNDMLKTFSFAKVYAQLSFVESFGCALAEAMSIGCNPVVTNRGALPEVVGDTGSIVEYGDVEAATRAVERGLQRGRCAPAVERIRRQFSLESRRDRLLAIVGEVIEQQQSNRG